MQTEPLSLAQTNANYFCQVLVAAIAIGRQKWEKHPTLLVWEVQEMRREAESVYVNYYWFAYIYIYMCIYTVNHWKYYSIIYVVVVVVVIELVIFLETKE